MQKSLFYKFLTVGGLALLLLLPLSMVQNIVNEREIYRIGVMHDIAESRTGPQKITGAMIVAPYVEKTTKEVEIYEDGEKRTILKTEHIQRHKYFMPETLNIQGSITTEERYRGIYKVPVYTTQLAVQGEFAIPQHLGITENLDNISWKEPFVVMGIEDIRGISRSVSIHVNQQPLEVLSGTYTHAIPQGIHARIDTSFEKAQSLAVHIALELQGMERLSFLPTGKFTKVDLTSPWPHPGFIGRYLPKTRRITDKGFTASWETSFFASNMVQYMQNCMQDNQCRQFQDNSFGVSLQEGVDIYLQAERSLKYALLFVGLTFVAFFLCEVLKGLSIHPVQYGLVGTALAVFYLLLVSLSEHIAFSLAYSIASSACVALLGFYVSYVLRSMSRGLIFAGGLAGLYGALYMLIRSEDYALLMGAALIFVVLAFIMVITRHIDWHKVGISALPKSASNVPAESHSGRGGRVAKTFPSPGSEENQNPWQ